MIRFRCKFKKTAFDIQRRILILGFQKIDSMKIIFRSVSIFLIPVFLFLLLSMTVEAQLSGFKNQDTTERIAPQNAIIKANVKSSTKNDPRVGDGYVFKSWKAADIMMNGSDVVITNIPVKLDAHNNLLEILHEGKIKTLSSGNVKSIVIASEQTTYITDALLDSGSPKGFYRLIYNRSSTLLCRYYSEIRKSSYNRAIDMGDRTEGVMLEKEYYLLLGGKMIKLEANRKRLARQFDNNRKIYEYILSEKLHPKNEFDLVKLVTFCDSINGNT